MLYLTKFPVQTSVYSIRILCFILFYAVISIFQILSGQSANFNSDFEKQADLFFKNYTSEDGLPDLTVHHINKNQNGFMMMSTRSGVFIFDGKTFTPLNYDMQYSTQAPVHRVWSTIQTKSSQYFIGTINEGLFIYDPVQETTQNLTFDGNNTVTTLLETNDGKVWAGTEGSGLCKIESGQTANAICYEQPDSLTHSSLNTIMDLIELDDDKLIVGTYGNGVQLFDRINNRFELLGSPELFVMSVTLKNNLLFAGTKFNGLYRIDLETLDEIYYNHHHKYLKQTESDFIWPVLAGSNGHIWAGSYGNGLFRLINPASDPNEAVFSHFTNNKNNPYSISDNFILALYEDDNGLFWAGNDNNGVSNFQTDPIFKKPRYYNTESISLSDAFVIINQYTDSVGRTWISTDDGVFLNENMVTKRISSDMSGIRIQQITEDANGRIWMTSNQGLLRYDEERESIFKVEIRNEQGLELDRAFYIYEIEENRFWISSNNSLWFAEIQENGKFLTRHFSESENTPITYSSFLHLKNGDIWIIRGGNDFAIFKNSDVSQFSLLSDQVSGSQFNLTSQIQNVEQDRDGTIWFATSNGVLHQVNRDENQYKIKSFQLPGRRFRDMALHQNRIWLITDDGLALFDPFEEAFQVIHIPAGFGNRSLRRIISTHGEHITINGAAGARVFNPEHVTSEKSPATVTLRSAKYLSGERIPLETDEDHLIELNYDQNNLQFEFALLDFRAPENHMFRYKMDGLNNEWIDIGHTNRAIVTNLPAGKYNLQVEVTDSFGHKHRKDSLASVLVKPPFWQTWWFKMVISLLILGAFTAFYLYRITSLKRVEKVRQRIADDLHDDIGSKVSSIALLLDLILHDQSSEENQSTLQKARSISREVTSDIRDTIWLIDQKNDTWGSFEFKIRQFANTMIQAESLKVSVDTLQSRRLPMDKRRNLFLFIKEALHNIQKHAHADTVSIEIESNTDHQYQLTISDNGVGFKKSSIIQGRGFKTMKKRANLLNGICSIESSPGAGTQIKLSFKIA